MACNDTIWDGRGMRGVNGCFLLFTCNLMAHDAPNARDQEE